MSSALRRSCQSTSSDRSSPCYERSWWPTEGPSLPSDELSGESLIRDQLDFSATLVMLFGEDVFWTTAAAVSPAWRYDLQNQVDLCAVYTGCAVVAVSPDDSRYVVRTQFQTDVSVRVAKGISIDVGYGNAGNQLGPDGRRRSLFYSPAAVFFASVSVFPHELVTGSKQVAQNVAASPSL